MGKKSEIFKWAVQILASVLTALATALGTTSCVALAMAS